MRYFGKIGYVANSTNTVVIGSMSAGRLYDKINDEYFAKIRFVTSSVALARVLTSDEYIAETPKATYTTYQTIWERLTLNSLRKT